MNKDNIPYIKSLTFNYKKESILVTLEGIHFLHKNISKKLKWIDITEIDIKKGFTKDSLLINNFYCMNVTRLNRGKIKKIQLLLPQLQRLQKIKEFEENINYRTELNSLNLIHNELYPEVIPLTLANFFHFLARDENGQCDIILYHYILDLFSNFSSYQKKLVERRLNSISSLSEETIFNQLSNINDLLTNEIRLSILVVTTDILNVRNLTDSKEYKKILSLLKATLKI